jgi:hypothetical protein
MGIQKVSFLTCSFNSRRRNSGYIAEPTIMKNVKFEVTQPELLLLITLISDQLFRREFIDVESQSQPRRRVLNADPSFHFGGGDRTSPSSFKMQ